MFKKFFKKENKQLLILYATQTGTTEKFAKNLYISANARNFETGLARMDEYDFKRKLQHEKQILFLLSTFYNGEFPDNGQVFWRFLSEKLPKDYLSNLNYSVFGLGNSSFKVKNIALHFIYLNIYILFRTPLRDQQDY